MYHFSCAVEGYCAYVLAQSSARGETNPWCEALAENVQQMREADLETMIFADFFALDNAFHRLLIDSLEDEYIRRLNAAKRGFYDWPDLHLTTRPMDRAAILAVHSDILQAIQKGDAPAAYQAMIHHADAVYQSYLSDIT